MIASVPGSVVPPNATDPLVAEIIEDIRGNRLKLPILPRVAMKVRQVVDDQSADAVALAQIIVTDPALSARLLQVVNCPLYRGNAPIDDIQMAVTRLGNNKIRTLVTSLVVQQLFEVKDAASRRLLTRLWLHSIEVAAISHVLARRYTKLNTDEALLAGLIHDIGYLPIIGKLIDYPELASDTARFNALAARLHHAVGKLVLQAWQLPSPLIDVAAQHENFTERSGAVDYVDVVTVANLHSRVGSTHPLATVSWETVPAFAKLGLDPEHSLQALEEAQEEVAEVKRVFA